METTGFKDNRKEHGNYRVQGLEIMEKKMATTGVRVER